MIGKWKLHMLALATTALVPLSAHAQDAQPAQEASVDEIVVTAQRRAERLVEVPITITSVSAEQLEVESIRTVKDLGRTSASVNITHNGGWTEPAIRGVSSRVGENSVAVYIDGLYNPSKISIDADFNDVSQVDVLKGPQGTLFGRNTTGGAIMITTADPTMDPTFRVVGGLEERNGRSISIYGAIGLTDTLAASLSLGARSTDGWNTKGVDPVSMTGVPEGTPLNQQWHELERLKLLWTPNDDLRVTLIAEHGASQDPTGLNRSVFDHQLVQPAAPVVRNRSYQSFTADNRVYWGVGSAKIEYQIDENLSMMSLTGFRAETSHLFADVDTRDANTASAGWFSNDRTFSHEMTLNYGGSQWDWVAGLFYYDNYFEKKYRSANLVSQQRTLAVAPFADITYRMNDNWSFIVGGRFSYEKREFDYQRPIVAPATVAFENSEDYTDFSPRLVARYSFDENTNVYASYSKGFKSGLFNTDAVGLTSASQAAAQPLESEELTAWEVGYKTVQPRFSLSTAAYFYDWQNIQVSRYTGVTTIFQNAASATVYGLEIQGSYDVTDDFRLRLNLGLSKGRWDSFTALSVNIPVNPADPNSPNSVATSQDVSGDRLLRSPDVSGNLAADYTLRTGFGDIDFTGSVFYTSEYSTATSRRDPLTNRPSRVVGPYTLVSGSATWHASDNITVQIYARNLFDEAYLQDADSNIFGDNGVWGEPRTFGFKIGYEY